MKTYKTRLELHQAWKPVSAIIHAITQAMEIANRADSVIRREYENEEGNLPQWAGFNSVFGKLRESLDMVLTDFFGVALADPLEVSWGGTDSFANDLFEALAAELVKPAGVVKKEKDPRYTILKNEAGERFVKLTPSNQVIPADIAGLCAGPDAWIAEIKCKCRDCGGLFTLRELQGNGRWCEPCQAAGIEEE
jgi:hypothetical protein